MNPYISPYFKPKPAAAPAPASAPANPAQSDSFRPTAAAGVSPGQTPPTAQPSYPATRAAPRTTVPSSWLHEAPVDYPPTPAPRLGFNPEDRAKRDAAARAVPLDPWRPGAGAVRYYPADRHIPKPPSMVGPARRHSLFEEYLRTSPSASSSSRPNRPPASGPVRPTAYHPYPPPAAAAAATAPAPASQPPPADRAQNTHTKHYPVDQRRR